METLQQLPEIERDADVQQRAGRVALEAGVVKKLSQLAARAETYAEAAGLNIDSVLKGETDGGVSAF
jgi:hypothetical protein